MKEEREKRRIQLHNKMRKDQRKTVDKDLAAVIYKLYMKLVNIASSPPEFGSSGGFGQAAMATGILSMPASRLGRLDLVQRASPMV